jgi:hypothetical protein
MDAVDVCICLKVDIAKPTTTEYCFYLQYFMPTVGGD